MTTPKTRLKPENPDADFWLERHYRSEAVTAVAQYVKFLSSESFSPAGQETQDDLDRMIEQLTARRRALEDLAPNMPRTSCGTPNNL